MNEAYVTARIRAAMTQRGYLTRKIAGTLHSAFMPDSYVCKNGITVFLEMKLIKVRSVWKDFKCPFAITPQLTSMEQHDKFGRAYYLIFVTDGEDKFVVAMKPSMFREWIVKGLPVPITTLYEKESEWLNESLPRMFK